MFETDENHGDRTNDEPGYDDAISMTSYSFVPYILAQCYN